MVGADVMLGGGVASLDNDGLLAGGGECHKELMGGAGTAEEDTALGLREAADEVELLLGGLFLLLPPLREAAAAAARLVDKEGLF
jgi:hypothetical protein